MSSYNDRKGGKDRRKQAYNFLIGKGLEPHLAAGVVGNLMVESYSNINSSAINKSSGAIGIAQWLGKRKDYLYKYAKEQKKPVTDFNLQLEYLYNEIDSTYQGDKGGWSKKQQARFFNAKTVEAASDAFANEFERAGDHEENLKLRRKHAATIFLEHNDKNIYAKDKRGEIISLNPDTATVDQIKDSPMIKGEFYNSEVYRIDKEAQIKELKLKAELEKAKKKLAEGNNEEKFISDLVNPSSTTKEQAAAEEEVVKAQQDTSNGLQADLFSKMFNNVETPTQTAVNTPTAGIDMYPSLAVPENEFFASFGVDEFGEGGDVKDPLKKHSTEEDYPGGEGVNSGVGPIVNNPSSTSTEIQIPDFTSDYEPTPQQVPTNSVEISVEDQAAVDAANSAVELEKSQAMYKEMFDAKNKEQEVYNTAQDIEAQAEYLRLSGNLNANLNPDGLSIKEKDSQVNKITNPQDFKITLSPEQQANLKPSSITSMEEGVTEVNLDAPNLDISKLNKTQVKTLQRELVASGDLKLQESIPSKGDTTGITALQLKLKSAGYDLGNYGLNKDGIDGKLGGKTLRAIAAYNKEGSVIDGKLGPITEGAYANYKSRLDKPIETITTPSEDITTPEGEEGVHNRDGVDRVTIDGKLQPIKQNVVRKKFNEIIPTSGRTLVSDVANQLFTQVTKGERAGKKDYSTITENNFPEDQLSSLNTLVTTLLDKGKTSISSYDEWREYANMSGDSIEDGVNLDNPANIIGQTLGRANISVDEDGNVFVEDRYNFNDASNDEENPTTYADLQKNRNMVPWSDNEKGETQSLSGAVYALGRNTGGVFGSAEGEGAKVSIFVGNIDDLKLSKITKKKLKLKYLKKTS